MENIIQELIKIEKAAKVTSREAEEQKRDLPRRLETQSRQITRRIEKEAGEQAVKLREQSKALLAEKKAECDSASRQKTEMLEKEFAARAQEWEEWIFTACLKTHI